MIKIIFNVSDISLEKIDQTPNFFEARSSSIWQ